MRLARALLVLLVLAGCRGVASPAAVPARETARGVVLTIARAIDSADLVCAVTAKTRKDILAAKKCADGYEVARLDVLRASALLDAGEAKHDAPVLICMLIEATESLKKMAESIVSMEAKVPPIVDDALKLSQATGGKCQ